MIAYAATQRLGEIATRLALGATPAQAFWLMMRRGQAMAVFGVAAGLTIAYVAGRSVSSLVSGVRASDPLVLLSATLIVVLITSIATALPARRASRVDPILALRGD